MEFISGKLFLALVILFLFFLYWIFNFIILYHLARFGVGTQPKTFAAVFLLGSIALFFICILLFESVDIKEVGFQLNKIGSEMFKITNTI
jgi:hypothetical protein